MELLEELGGFDCAVRGQMVVPRIGEVTRISVIYLDYRHYDGGKGNKSLLRGFMF
jgi:hypothetical protein